MNARPFDVGVSEEVLVDLHDRLLRTRWAETIEDEGWNAGVQHSYLRSLVEYWRDTFDWREQEAAINRFSHFRAEVDGCDLHFIHERARNPGALPLVLTHGFPDSFLRFAKVIPMLTDPAAHGGDAMDAFDVVVPSLPGYGFSAPPTGSGATFRIGDMWHTLMTRTLGYERFGAHGGDWGATVTEHLARSHPTSLVGIHLTDVPFWHQFQKPHDPSREEEAFFARTDAWVQKDGAYALIQGSRPYTLAAALNDSPVGLAAWIVDKFYRWSDCAGDVETRFTKDELPTNVTLYWATGTIGSSFRPYSDFTNAGTMRWLVEAFKQWTGSSQVPAAFALFPKDLSTPPREWAQRFFNVQRWTEMPRGGHFAAMEEPEILVEDIRAFFRPLRSSAAREDAAGVTAR
jgi:pimeloyl-ACP methyl ester carboxylesterase